jgi:hypothetical protein
MTFSKVLFFNHKQKQCGVYQYGYRTAQTLKKSSVYDFIYCEAETKNEYLTLVNAHSPVAIFYNYHGSTMDWLGNDSLNAFPNTKHFGLHHEGSEPGIKFDATIILDSTYQDNGNHFAVPRPLFETKEALNQNNKIPIISSFGFGFGTKGFGRLAKMVNDQFDEAILRFHIPSAFYGDKEGRGAVNLTLQGQKEIKKDKIQFIVTTNFLDNEGVLNFLATSDLNAFLYDERGPTSGLSSVIDYALSVKVPIAVSKTQMFRHIFRTVPSICVEDRSLKEIIQSGSDPLQQYRNLYCNDNFIKKYEHIINVSPRIKR